MAFFSTLKYVKSVNISGDLVSMAKFKIVVCDVKPCQPRGPIVSSVMDDSDSIYIALASGRLVGQLLPSLCSCQRQKKRIKYVWECFQNFSVCHKKILL